jgi:hypothetical protein
MSVEGYWQRFQIQKEQKEKEATFLQISVDNFGIWHNCVIKYLFSILLGKENNA